MPETMLAGAQVIAMTRPETPPGSAGYLAAGSPGTHNRPQRLTLLAAITGFAGPPGWMPPARYPASDGSGPT